MSPSSFDNGSTDLNADCYINTVDENITKAKNFVNLRDVAMVTNFVARDGDKLAYPTYIVCAGILQRRGISQRRLSRLLR